MDNNVLVVRLPQIQEELEKSIMSTRNNLIQLPKKPSDDPRSEISALLHDFTIDVARHVEGVPICTVGPFANHSKGREGLIQDINAAQGRFHTSIRATAPNFRPFEKKDAQNKHLHSPAFLRLEEGDGFEDEMSNDEDPIDLPTPNTRKKNTSQPKIYIDEVLEVAAMYEYYYERFAWYLLTKMQVANSRVTRALPFRRSENVYPEYRRKVAHSCFKSHQHCV